MLFGAVSTELQLAWGIQPRHGEQRHRAGNKDMGQGIQKIWPGTTSFSQNDLNGLTHIINTKCTTHENQNGSTRVSRGVLLNPALLCCVVLFGRARDTMCKRAQQVQDPKSNMTFPLVPRHMPAHKIQCSQSASPHSPSLPHPFPSALPPPL